MAVYPQWSERLSITGPPEQSLRADSVRNGMISTIVRGVSTDVRARGRYLSGVCWAMYRLSESPSAAELFGSGKRRILKGFEEVLALASYRQQRIQGELKDGLSGLTGNTNVSNDDLYESATIDFRSAPFRVPDVNPTRVEDD